MDNFATQLQHLRRQRGLSQTQLAEALGVERQTISLWERGVREPQKANRQRVFDYFADDPAPDQPADISNADVAAMIQGLQFSIMQLQQRVDDMRKDCCND